MKNSKCVIIQSKVKLKLQFQKGSSYLDPEQMTQMYEKIKMEV